MTSTSPSQALALQTKYFEPDEEEHSQVVQQVGSPIDEPEMTFEDINKMRISMGLKPLLRENELSSTPPQNSESVFKKVTGWMPNPFNYTGTSPLGWVPNPFKSTDSSSKLGKVESAQEQTTPTEEAEKQTGTELNETSADKVVESDDLDANHIGEDEVFIMDEDQPKDASSNKLLTTLLLTRTWRTVCLPYV